MMKKLSIVTASSLLLLLGSLKDARAEIFTLDFDELTHFEILNDQYADIGVTFFNSGGPLRVHSSVPGSPFTAPNAILPQNFSTVGNYTQATFSLPTDFVSVTLGDFNQDADNLFLELYNSADTLIASDFYALPASVSGGHTLTAEASNVAYARFYGVGVGQNSVYFDNFSFGVAEVEVEPVPEPTSVLSLLAFGTLGFIGLKHKK